MFPSGADKMSMPSPTPCRPTAPFPSCRLRQHGDGDPSAGARHVVQSPYGKRGQPREPVDCLVAGGGISAVGVRALVYVDRDAPGAPSSVALRAPDAPGVVSPMPVSSPAFGHRHASFASTSDASHGL